MSDLRELGSHCGRAAAREFHLRSVSPGYDDRPPMRLKLIFTGMTLLLAGVSPLPAQTESLATRSARFWMTRNPGESADPECATLLNVIAGNSNQVDLG